MASTVPNLQGPGLKSSFLGRSVLRHHRPAAVPGHHHSPPNICLRPSAKFNLSELLGGRGLCNGEKGVEIELKRNITEESPPSAENRETDEVVPEASGSEISVPEDAFEKELMGLTGGFPGGEKGLELFIEKNPPPPKKPEASTAASIIPSSKPKPPELPLLMPGMIAIVKNPNNPFYMYCGIVQRITDGKAGVLFEGGNWDRLITFRLEELERREKGPPMKNPKSAVLEELLKKEP
ncbi:NAD(P)H-quinone oxidoreductase subunit S, chloroplastic [Punica granatum]|uniref:Uncharacterized protein n=2 Tax=Punica granatum TaxID=22663 RepID=A0A218XJS8_PUNGR|nr:NAD(P)H-quinone oxidoreductase subunit S, chloroplastic [Punica granatum]OWM85223.1 hypothetical protein CDL15_Pgr028010 [Punica granatum]PKI45320.1 hypothetical protein CRG98_034281 [Punica granatum]